MRLPDCLPSVLAQTFQEEVVFEENVNKKRKTPLWLHLLYRECMQSLLWWTLTWSGSSPTSDQYRAHRQRTVALGGRIQACSGPVYGVR